MNFWKEIDKPIIGLAPMDGITDYPMRTVLSEIAKPDVIYTEFISVEGYSRVPDRFEKKLMFDKSQKPVVVQLFGHTPEDFKKAAELVVNHKFDGIDINMGCPARTVTHRGGGGALIGNYDLAEKIITNCLEITEKHNIPLSVKTRIGIDKVITKEWIEFLSRFNLSCIVLHGRLLKQVHSGDVNWYEIQIAAEIAHKNNILLIGNGGVKSREAGEEISNIYGLDGVLIGQASEGNPWVFKENYEPTIEDRFAAIIKHAKLAEKFYGPKGFVSARKHFAWYCKGIENSKELRTKLVMCNTSKEVTEVINNNSPLKRIQHKNH